MKKIILIATALVMAMFSAAAQDMAQATATAQDANSALLLGDNETALNGFKMALEQASACGDEGADLVNTCKEVIPRIILSMGKDQIKAKNYDAALAKVNEALASAEEYGNEDIAAKAAELIPGIKMSKANELLNAKDFAGAAAAFKAILESDPTNGPAAVRLGAALNATGDIEGAKAAYDTAIANGQEKAASKPMSNIYVKEAQALLKGGKYKEAIEAAVKSNSYLENANAYKMAATAATKIKDNDAALGFYEKYLEVAPNAKDANGIIYTIAVLHQQAGNKAKAIEYYQKVVTDPQYGEGAKAQLSVLNK